MAAGRHAARARLGGRHARFLVGDGLQKWRNRRQPVAQRHHVEVTAFDRRPADVHVRDDDVERSGVGGSERGAAERDGALQASLEVVGVQRLLPARAR